MKKKKIIFYTQSSQKIGLGHLYRIKNLIEFIVDNSFCEVILITNQNELLKTIKIKKRNLIITKKIASKKFILKVFNKEQGSLLFCDISHPNYLKSNSKYLKNFFKFFLKKNITTISLDDPFQNIFSDYSIIPYDINKFELKKKLKFKSNKKIFVGLKYLPIKKYQFKEKSNFKIKKILIILSGYPKSNNILSLMRIFKKLDQNNYNFKIVTKNAAQIKSRLIKVISKKKINILDKAKNINNLLKWSDFIVFGSGMIKYEVLNSGKPGIMIHTLQRSKDYMVLSFIRKYFNIINIQNLHSKKSFELIKKSLEKKYLKVFFRKNARYIFNNNNNNILKILNKIKL